jgi:hypothetical protein
MAGRGLYLLCNYSNLLISLSKVNCQFKKIDGRYCLYFYGWQIFTMTLSIF